MENPKHRRAVRLWTPKKYKTGVPKETDIYNIYKAVYIYI